MFLKIWSKLKAPHSFFEKAPEEKIEKTTAVNKPTLQSVGSEHDAGDKENKLESINAELALLAQTQDVTALEKWAIEGRSAALRQQAVMRIDDLFSLRRIEALTKNKDKTVHRIAKNKLQEHRGREQQIHRMQETCEHICAAMEIQLYAAIDGMYEAKWRLLQQQWQQVPSEFKTTCEARFLAVNTQCEEKWQAHCVEQKRNQEEARYEQEQACAALEQISALMQSAEGLVQSDIPGLKAILTTQHNRWHVAQDSCVPDEALAARFQKHYDQVLDGLVTLAQIREQPKKVNQQPAKEQQAHERELIEQVKQKIVEARALLEAGCVAETQHAVKAMHHLLAPLPKEKQMKLLAQARDLMAQLEELKRWHNFALTPKKEALCQAMEALITEHNEPEVLADKIKALQDEWKSLGHADAKNEQELWIRFKAAGDQAYEPCRLYYAQQAQYRQDNAEKRGVLCEQLEMYERANDWKQADWFSVLATIKLAKAEWRACSPVDRKHHSALQARFDRVIAALQIHLDEEYERNQRQKKRLIDQAKALLEKDALPDAIVEAKQLQQAWRQIGLVPPKVESALWSEFRGYCNVLFERRQQSFAEQEAAQSNNQKTAEALIAELQQLTDGPLLAVRTHRELSAIVYQAETLGEHFEALLPLPKTVASQLTKKFSTLRRHFQQQHKQIKKQLADAQLNALWRKAELCAQLEAWALAGEHNPAQIETVKQQWETLDDVTELAGTALTVRFNNALTALLEKQYEVLQNNLEKSRAVCHELVLRMEILTSVESPKEDREKRMALQVSRLAQTMGQGKAKQTDQEAERLYLAWCANGPVGNSPEITGWTERFKRAAANIVGL